MKQYLQGFLVCLEAPLQLVHHVIHSLECTCAAAFAPAECLRPEEALLLTELHLRKEHHLLAFVHLDDGSTPIQASLQFHLTPNLLQASSLNPPANNGWRYEYIYLYIYIYTDIGA